MARISDTDCVISSNNGTTIVAAPASGKGNSEPPGPGIGGIDPQPTSFSISWASASNLDLAVGKTIRIMVEAK